MQLSEEKLVNKEIVNINPVKKPTFKLEMRVNGVRVEDLRNDSSHNKNKLFIDN